MRQLKDFNEDKFLCDLRMNEWNQVFILNNPDEMWNFWKHLLISVIDIKHAPLKTKTIRNNRYPWITNELVGEIHKRDFLKKKATSTNDALIWTEFKDSRNKVNKSIKKSNANIFRRNWTQVNVIHVKHGG